MLILDEVQVAPANCFKKSFLQNTKSHCKIGLTATLVREDNKIEDLIYYLGPKIFEENSIDLTNQGFLARVICKEVRVDLHQIFESLLQNNQANQLVYVANPNKFRVLEYLINKHRLKNDKILIFVDSILLIKMFARLLNYPFITGELSHFERSTLFDLFRSSPDWNVLFVSRVGDVGVDLPDANVAIQMSSFYCSRRQEAQRLGRVLRPKIKKSGKEVKSYFYSIITNIQDELFYAQKRQKFLVKNGYNFKLIRQENFKIFRDRGELEKLILGTNENIQDYKNNFKKCIKNEGVD